MGQGVVVNKAMYGAVLVAAGALGVSAAQAQTASNPPDAPDPATIAMPALAFTPTAEDDGAYDKFFYFHRDATSFAEAWADIRECDALSSGANIYLSSGPAMNPAFVQQYGALGAGVGGAIGAALADALVGSAMRRAQYRINMRTCMSFKGYKRYALNRALWEQFNFAEGNGRKHESVRNAALAQQALVAAQATPASKELEP